MNTYELRVHSVGLDRQGLGYLFQHTGFSLIEKDAQGNVVKITRLDLFPTNYEANVHFTVANESLSIIANPDFKTRLITADSAFALDVFNRMSVEAKFMNKYSQFIDYDFWDRNCNTSTKYFADKYLGGVDLFSGGWAWHDIFVGEDEDFVLNNPYISLASEIADSIIATGAEGAFENFLDSVPEGFDWSGFEVTGYGSDYFVFSDGVSVYNTYGGSIGRTILGTDFADRIIGTNGNDFIHGYDGYDKIYGDAGNNYINTLYDCGCSLAV